MRTILVTTYGAVVPAAQHGFMYEVVQTNILTNPNTGEPTLVITVGNLVPQPWHISAVVQAL